MEEKLIYQDRAEYEGKVGTLILTGNEIRFSHISSSGKSNILFRCPMGFLIAEVKGFLSKRLSLLDGSTNFNHMLKVSNPDVWLVKINAVRKEG